MAQYPPGPKPRHPPELPKRAVRMYVEAVDHAGTAGYCHESRAARRR